MCEACGEASDPGRLLLCDDCDISYHTYCLDPPLHTVPKGAWKCKWWVHLSITCQSDSVFVVLKCVLSSLTVCMLSSGVCGVSSVAPPPLGCTVIGRITTVAVDHVIV